MLNIYYGNERRDREKFIFDSIKAARDSGRGNRTVVLVPDQSSLQAEKAALERLGQRGLMDLMVVDFSSLGGKVVKRAAVKEPELIDKYGRHMLLTSVTESISSELNVYGKYGGKSSFAAMVNQLISEMKRCGVTPDIIGESAASDSMQNTFLKSKLLDIEKIYRAYEEAIEGRFLDSEDYVRFYGSLMADSDLILGADIWIYGFETFTPLNYEIIKILASAAASLNIVMNYERTLPDGESEIKDARLLTTGGGEGLFDLTGHVMQRLLDMADELGVQASAREIAGGEELARRSVWDQDEMDVTLVQTSGIYAEADRLAAWIISLVRDEGYSCEDIVVICNDMDTRGRIIIRTLEKYGIPVFADKKRTVLHQPVCSFIMALCDVIAGREDIRSVMMLVKSGLLGWADRDEELLENYLSEYRIRSAGLKKPFTKKGGKYSDRDMEKLNRMRESLLDILQQARDQVGRRNTAADKISGLYSFLESDFDIRGRIEKVIDEQEALGLAEAAAETFQSWSMICRLFEQILRIEGDSRISNVRLSDMLRSGFEAMEIGIVPSGSDMVIVGTMQRTRISRAKALAVVAANEGILPMMGSGGGMLTERELDTLEELKVSVAKRDSVLKQEEQLAIYRTMSAPEERIYMSCSLSDLEGKATAPSQVFESLIKLCPGREILGDLDSSENKLDMLSTGRGSMGYVAKALRDYAEGAEIDDLWFDAFGWYRDNDRSASDRLIQGLSFSNEEETIGRELAEALYSGKEGKLLFSASRLENFAGCPFAYFMNYGLRADEQRSFEIDPRDIGDIYHECLMDFSRSLTPEDGCLDGSGKDKWMTLSEEECRTRVRELLIKEAKSHREGIFSDDNAGSFRLQCIEEVCADVAWAIVEQVRHGKIREMYFEEEFGGDGELKLTLDDGREVGLTGKIDRMDIIGREKAVRVIDYKTGNVDLDLEQMKAGYKLQLMMYMNAARAVRPGANGGEEGRQPDPAGVFYFMIKDYMDKKNDRPKGDTPEERQAELKRLIRKSYRLEGVLVDDPGLIEEMDTDLEGVEGGDRPTDSLILPVKYVKNNECYDTKGNGILITPDEFTELCLETYSHVKRICGEICDGRITVLPVREKKKNPSSAGKSACDYCQYRSICMFDTSFEGCRFNNI